jgi:hypothetical protein
LVEHLVYTEGVGGSSPSSPTTKIPRKCCIAPASRTRPSAAAGEGDAGFCLLDGLVDQTDGALAMAAFVRRGVVKFSPRGLKRSERVLHVRLLRRRACK